MAVGIRTLEKRRERWREGGGKVDVTIRLQSLHTCKMNEYTDTRVIIDYNKTNSMRADSTVS